VKLRAAISYAAYVLRLNLRNPMALIYGYLFPLVFLAAFAIIYRHDAAPIISHLGALLTVTALGGACFGLPTAIVAERERGIWRRYRATPAGAAPFIAGQLLSRLALLLSAAAIQLFIAIALLGMPLPTDPIGLIGAFLLVSLALIGLGMIVAMLAGSVPAVQALGQCIFLPMLMIGGVAVRLSSLPNWVQTLSAFFPGRYAVTALQASATGGGIASAGFALIALGGFALASALIAANLFRWDSNRPRIRRGWLAAGLALWLAIGIAGAGESVEQPRAMADEEPVAPPAAFLRVQTADTAPSPEPHSTSAENSATAKPSLPTPSPATEDAPVSWQTVTPQHIALIAFERLPDDEGIVAPMAARGTLEDAAVEQQIATVRAGLPGWSPAHVAQPEQRVRNLLYIAAVPDLLQMDPLERHLPWLVFDRLRQDVPPADLSRILYWIAQHPQDGADDAIAQLDALGLPTVSGPTRKVRERAMLYAMKFLERLEATRAPTG
jgi:ABC-type multidrug transport system permease subunit